MSIRDYLIYMHTHIKIQCQLAILIDAAKEMHTNVKAAWKSLFYIKLSLNELMEFIANHFDPMNFM